MHSIQLYVIKFVSDLRQVSGFLRVLRFSQPIKLTATKILMKRALNTITLINASLYCLFCLKKKSCIKVLDIKTFLCQNDNYLSIDENMLFGFLLIYIVNIIGKILRE